jgi:hypothetical protein
LAPILISFSRKLVSDHQSAGGILVAALILLAAKGGRRSAA